MEKGQWEAAFAVGLSYRQSLRYVVIPQATRLAIPPLSNVMLDLVKSSSIAAIISVPEIFQKAKVMRASEHDFMTLTYFLLLISITLTACTTKSEYLNSDKEQLKAFLISQHTLYIEMKRR